MVRTGAFSVAGSVRLEIRIRAAAVALMTAASAWLVHRLIAGTEPVLGLSIQLLSFVFWMASFVWRIFKLRKEYREAMAREILEV